MAVEIALDHYAVFVMRADFDYGDFGCAVLVRATD
jgi:hypothetical protein